MLSVKNMKVIIYKFIIYYLLLLFILFFFLKKKKILEIKYLKVLNI